MINSSKENKQNNLSALNEKPPVVHLQDREELQETQNNDTQGELDVGTPGCGIIMYFAGISVDHPCYPYCSRDVQIIRAC